MRLGEALVEACIRHGYGVNQLNGHKYPGTGRVPRKRVKTAENALESVKQPG